MKKVYPQFYGTIKEKSGHNKFVLDNAMYWQKYLDNSLKDGQRITIALKPYYKPRTTGSIKDKDEGKGNQNGYYWVVVLPILAEEWGIEVQEAHKEVTAYFLPKPSRIDPNKIIGGSTQKLNRLEWEDLMERIRVWALVEKQITIPLPNEVIDDDEEAPLVDEHVEPEPDPINPLIELFKTVNPSYARLYANTNQRKALERLIKLHGIEKIAAIIKFLPTSNAHKHAPTITTPYNLEAKLGDLIAWSQKQKANQRKTANLGNKQ